MREKLCDVFVGTILEPGARVPCRRWIGKRAVLDLLPPHAAPKVVFGTGCRIGAARLKRECIAFRQIPYEVRVE